MPIPPLTEHGLLPPGIHLATMQEIVERYCHNDHRRALWADLLVFLVRLRDDDLGDYPLCLGGSFTSDKPMPPDTDLAIDLQAATRFHQFVGCMLFTEHHHDIKASHRVDFYPNLPGNSDFTAYFQYIGEKTALAKGLQATDLRGVLRITTWAHGLNS